MIRLALWASNCNRLDSPANSSFERGLEFCVGNSVNCLILPETTFSGFIPSKGQEWAQSLDKQTCDSIKTVADRYGLTILYGTWSLDAAGNLRNVARIISPRSSIYLETSKHRPFSLMNEGDYVEPSSEIGIVELLPGVPALIGICYDLRFPQIYWRAAPFVLLMITISNWPLMRSQALRTMLSSRAVENQCFSIGVNRSGVDERGITYGGESQVYDFHGQALRPLVRKHGISIFQLKLELVEEWRGLFPALRDRDSQSYN